MATIDDQNPNQPAIELSLDFASRSNNPATLAGACVAHPAFLLIPREAPTKFMTSPYAAPPRQRTKS
jgi:hypothetical protein